MSLLGKIWSNKYMFKTSKVQKEFGKLWGIEESLVVYVGGGVNIFQFIIPDDEVRRRVVLGGPWHFDKHLVVMRAWTDDDSCIIFNDSHFTRTPFWIQVLDLPIKFLNEAAAEKIAGEVGKCLKVQIRDKGSEEGGGRMLRLRIELDITKPLRRGIHLLDSEHIFWAPFRYEKLGSFCYICGCVGHTQWSCPQSSEIGGFYQYGPWLRAQDVILEETEEERKWLYENVGECKVDDKRQPTSSGSTSENKGRKKKVKGKREKKKGKHRASN
ncbi:uncharacterized protein LOC132273921 [Cornus florida]|uniref:uncharacterized protein LOC132273921 n=1 Tax=Cornus florida TaxID=4283 RepID=UPI0028984A6E|nr:uncharacterized protein LOC132273921 [Cornus florida]